ncbi:ATPase [Pseudonocardia sp. TMWB2A]
MRGHREPYPMRCSILQAAALLALAGLAAPAAAKVVDATDSGFAVTADYDIAVPPDALWAMLVQPELWWSAEHSWSGDAANFSLNPVAGGCFCERLVTPGSIDDHEEEVKYRANTVEHARVLYADSGKLLRLSGALGPLQSEAVTGTLSFTLTPGPTNSSKLRMDYIVGGYSRIPLKNVAPAVDKVMTEQMVRLKEAAEKSVGQKAVR